MANPSYLPEGFHTVNIYLIVSDARKLIEFAQAAFEAEEMLVMDDPSGCIHHAQLRIGDSIVELAEASENWKAMPASLHVYFSDCDAVYQRALAAGAVVIREPADQFYGERSASVQDPVGNMWHIATKTEDLPLDEVKRRAAELGRG